MGTIKNFKNHSLYLIPVSVYFKANIPVGIGKARGRQMSKREGDYTLDPSSDGCHGDKVINVLLHGDAAFVAQVRKKKFC